MAVSFAWRDYTIECVVSGDGISLPPTSPSFGEMELDHITPRADGGENHIRNRILLCRPCNGRKGQYLTLRGLLRENKKVNWMKDEGLAQLAREHARERADWVRDSFESEACQALIAL